MKTIFVRNINFKSSETDIGSLFQNYGVVERVKLPIDRDSGKPRGFAFVDMPNDGEAETAISALNGVLLHGRTLIVNEARPKEDPGRQ